MDLGLRRLLLIVLSIIGGVVLVYPMLSLIAVTTKQPVTAESYGTIYFVLSALPLALLVGIWLDYFMRTGIIPESNDPPAGAAPAKKGGRPAPAAAEAVEE